MPGCQNLERKDKGNPKMTRGFGARKLTGKEFKQRIGLDQNSPY